jgi:hypothetical protein
MFYANELGTDESSSEDYVVNAITAVSNLNKTEPVE